MDCLIGTFVKVVHALNRCMIGLEGVVVFQSNGLNNDSLVLLTSRGYKRIEKCLLRINDVYIWSCNRNTKGVKVKKRFTVL